MSQDLELRCRCGEVRGRVVGASPKTVNRTVCYCDDCQAFAHRLGRSDLLDANGGSDVVQVPPASLRLERGQERVVGLRLSPKGLFRFYASCCNTPLGNAVGPALPFVGIAARVLERPNDVVGPPFGAAHGKFAIGTPPRSAHSLPRVLARAIRKVLAWKLGGKAWPNPFFDRKTGAPSCPVSIVPRDEREALRPLCGPRS